MNIFVGTLAFTTTEQDLRQLFELYGSVETIRIMTDRDTGRARGFGFVELPDSRAAQDAMAGLYGTSVPGRTLTVNEAQPREPPAGAVPAPLVDGPSPPAARHASPPLPRWWVCPLGCDGGG